MYKKKIKELFIGSNNKGKLREIRDLLPKHVKIITPLNKKIISPKETSKTFKGNSLIKAKYFSSLSNKICLSDDSGLEIDLLNKAPGIYSARWAGKNKNFNLAIKKVYKNLEKKNKKWRTKRITARFICALTLYGPKFKTVSVIGKVEGRISKKKLGKNGFGYDPIFIPNGKKITFGQMEQSSKHSIDHRYMAFKKIKKFF